MIAPTAITTRIFYTKQGKFMCKISKLVGETLATTARATWRNFSRPIKNAQSTVADVARRSTSQKNIHDMLFVFEMD